MIELLSVNVGLPQVLGLQRGKPVSSAIRKAPVSADVVSVSLVNIEGDRQADLRVHGGPEKAIFAYPAAHLAAWGDEYRDGEPLRYGLIGENLTIGGIDERDVHIGDIWNWGSVRLQICQPRYPCFKLAMTVGEPGIIKRFLATARSGWYLRVLTPGEALVAGPITIEQMDPSMRRRGRHLARSSRRSGWRLRIIRHWRPRGGQICCVWPRWRSRRRRNV